MSKLKTIFHLIRKPRKIIRILGDKRFLNWLPDRTYLKLVYLSETGRILNLDNPQTYNEKLQWLKLYDRRPEYSIYADKYAVRSYIAETIGEQYLIPLLGVYNSVEEIDWGSLPDKFVLKCTHGSGSNIICSDKSKLNVEEAKKKLRKWMKHSWYWFGREWPYRNVIPRIICEQFIETDDGKAPIDYKVMCSNGEPKLIQVHIDRYGDTYTMDFYDINWEKTSICQGVPISKKTLEKPKNFHLMLNFARMLTKDMPYARIDFYEQNEVLYFGEITLYPTSGFALFENDNHDVDLGSWIYLNTRK